MMLTQTLLGELQAYEANKDPHMIGPTTDLVNSAQNFLTALRAGPPKA